jgi:PepSY-associated TM region
VRNPGLAFKKYLILCHRWLGVLFCVLFAMWFVSGMVLMYWTYPAVSDRDRLEHSPALDASQIRLNPQQALEAALAGEPPQEVRLEMLDHRPAYQFRFRRGEVTVFADDGTTLDPIDESAARRIASDWTGKPASAGQTLTAEDQWTVSGAFRPLRPLYKYAWPSGEQVYVSSVTAQVVQFTTRSSRLAAWLGAIPHWLYFTPLRKHASTWNRVVVWSAGIGTVMSLMGIAVGLWLYSPRKRYRFPDGLRSVPYSGYKRWHTILGLMFGLVTCTWVFSGMLSMDPFDWATDPGAGPLDASLRGTPWHAEPFDAMSPAQALGKAGPVKALDLVFFAGEPYYFAMTLESSKIVPITGMPRDQFDAREILRRLDRRDIRSAEILNTWDAYYVDRHGERPLPVLRVQLADTEGSLYYIDLKTARVVGAFNTLGRWNRWLYHGWHSLDLPWLYRHRPAWDVLVLSLMLGGTALCVTSLVIAWRRVRRKLAP